MINFNLMKSKRNVPIFFLFSVLIFAFLFFCAKSVSNMIIISFHDFDEAHRVEGARNMRLNHYYVSPLVGGPYNNGSETETQRYSLDPDKKIYPEKGRPPLVFSLMAISSQIFGDVEWAYRLPSFIFGILIFFLLFFLDFLLGIFNF